MTWTDFIAIGVFILLVGLIAKPLGSFVYRVFESDRQPLSGSLGRLELLLCRLCKVDRDKEQTWKQYTLSLLVFSLVGLLVSYALMRFQQVLPFNPQNLDPVPPDLAFNTASSFVSNTNWQAYAGETTMSYLSQMAALAWHNFTSAGTGIGVALALSRGLTRHPDSAGNHTVGNFWVDLIRSIVYLFLPICVMLTPIFVAQGVIQNLTPYQDISTVEGAKQLLAMGPVASQEVIKIFGTNGGGFFNANSAHPFENPTPLTNLIQMLLIFSIPAALTYTYGKMAKDQKQGWALFGAMAALFFVGALVSISAERQENPALHDLAIDQTQGNMEGKEVRFGVADSALFATITTQASCGAVNSMHDSFTPLGGLVTLLNIQLGEVIFGGVGAGLYGMLIFAIISVFIAGLMVGRTPEFLGKKVEAREIKLAMIYTLIFPFLILVMSAWAATTDMGTSSLANMGPHGLSEILYAFSSAAGNNGSAFAGLNANTVFWNLSLGLAMLAGRFLMLIPVLAIAGSMVQKMPVPANLGTFPTNTGLFVFLLAAVVIIIGALTFFPALSLGPILEHFLAANGRLFGP